MSIDDHTLHATFLSPGKEPSEQ